MLLLHCKISNKYANKNHWGTHFYIHRVLFNMKRQYSSIAVYGEGDDDEHNEQTDAAEDVIDGYSASPLEPPRKIGPSSSSSSIAKLSERFTCVHSIIAKIPLEESYAWRVTADLGVKSSIWFPKDGAVMKLLEENDYRGITVTRDYPKTTKRDYDNKFLSDGTKQYQHTTCLQRLIDRLGTVPLHRSTYEMCHISGGPKGPNHSWTRLHHDLELMVDSNTHITFDTWPELEADMLEEYALWVCSVFGLSVENVRYYITDASSRATGKISRHYTWILLLLLSHESTPPSTPSGSSSSSAGTAMYELVFDSNVDSGAINRCFECYVVDKYGDCSNMKNVWYIWCEKSKMSNPPNPRKDRKFIFDDIYTLKRSMRKPCEHKWPKSWELYQSQTTRPLRPLIPLPVGQYHSQINGPEVENKELCELLDKTVLGNDPFNMALRKALAQKTLRLMSPYTLMYPFVPGVQGAPVGMVVASCMEPDGKSKASSQRGRRGQHLDSLILQKKTAVALNSGDLLAEFMSNLHLGMNTGALSELNEASLPQLGTPEWARFAQKWKWKGSYWADRNMRTTGDPNSCFKPELCDNMLLDVYDALLNRLTLSELYGAYKLRKWNQRFEQHGPSVDVLSSNHALVWRYFENNGTKTPGQIIRAPVGRSGGGIRSIFRWSKFYAQEYVFIAYTTTHFCPRRWLDEVVEGKVSCRMTHKSNNSLLQINIQTMEFQWICTDYNECSTMAPLALPPSIMQQYTSIIQSFLGDMTNSVSLNMGEQMATIISSARSLHDRIE